MECLEVPPTTGESDDISHGPHNSTYRIGIMGGTFDPIHYGHLVTAEIARVEYRLDTVVFVPSGSPPHKKGYQVTPAEHRYMMTVLATITNPCFEVSRIEVDRPGLSYTIDTLEAFRELYGPQAELFFITGADATLEIFTWRDTQALLALCNFIAATRPGYDIERLESMVEEIRKYTKNSVHVMEVPALAISSTDIRRRVREGRSIRYLLPDAVASYIAKSGLYRASSDEIGQEQI